MRMINNQYNAKHESKRTSLVGYEENLQLDDRKKLGSGLGLNYKKSRAPRKIEFSVLRGPHTKVRLLIECTWNLESSDFPEFSGPAEVDYSSLLKSSTATLAWRQCKAFCMSPWSLFSPPIQDTRPINRVKLHHIPARDMLGLIR